ncbi:hypothetical protein HNP55_003221 [Paucibacter oligotrophus]|uniref:BrnA antitoxin of type II toxin-antitoxin system n=1 Tax=Roseateles oligotrophus TaxID=1769250 RepID=A0A840LHC9_9BURK|nr:hypothetical protein [Roseateles oligotrophus]MBB4844677.1 hypothetical protein [Roseateles oligotrophus]
MQHAAKIAGTVEAWETEQLGADAAHAKIATDHEDEIDAALELQPISIRLQKSLIENLKALGQLNGIGYQPLVRQILTRFVECEMKNLLKQRVAEQEAIQKMPARKSPSTKLKKAA